MTNLFLLSAKQDPGAIVGPIALVLGAICNFIFDFVYSFMTNASFGVTIILFTIVIRALLFPLGIKQQKSMVGMRRVQPEVDKIQKKYKDNKDPEIKQKMSMEISELYRKNKVSPFSGCLPMLVQMPILYALFYVLRESWRYIDVLKNVYSSIAAQIQSIAGYETVLAPFANQYLPKQTTFYMESLLQKLSSADWSRLLETLPGQDQVMQITQMLQTKNSIEHFFTISLIENSGTGFPGILIPLLAGLATFGSTMIMNKANAASATSDQARMQQKVMTFAMPVMMAVFAIPMPAGLGVYWIMSSLTQLAQQIILNKMYPFQKTDKKEIAKA